MGFQAPHVLKGADGYGDAAEEWSYASARGERERRVPSASSVSV